MSIFSTLVSFLLLSNVFSKDYHKPETSQNSEVEFYSSTFSDIKGDSAITCKNSSLTLRSCTFHNLHSLSAGSAVQFESPNKILMVNETNFTNCTSDEAGGAISAKAFQYTILTCNFKNCTAGTPYSRFPTYGGGVNLFSIKNGTIASASFHGCAASIGGGAIIFSSQAVCSLANSLFRDSLAYVLGAGVVVANPVMVKKVAATDPIDCLTNAIKNNTTVQTAILKCVTSPTVVSYSKKYDLTDPTLTDLIKFIITPKALERYHSSTKDMEHVNFGFLTLIFGDGILKSLHEGLGGDIDRNVFEALYQKLPLSVQDIIDDLKQYYIRCKGLLEQYESVFSQPFLELLPRSIFLSQDPLEAFTAYLFNPSTIDQIETIKNNDTDYRRALSVFVKGELLPNFPFIANHRQEDSQKFLTTYFSDTVIELISHFATSNVSEIVNFIFTEDIATKILTISEDEQTPRFQRVIHILGLEQIFFKILSSFQPQIINDTLSVFFVPELANQLTNLITSKAFSMSQSSESPSYFSFLFNKNFTTLLFEELDYSHITLLSPTFDRYMVDSYVRLSTLIKPFLFTLTAVLDKKYSQKVFAITDLIFDHTLIDSLLYSRNHNALLEHYFNLSAFKELNISSFKEYVQKYVYNKKLLDKIVFLVKNSSSPLQFICDSLPLLFINEDYHHDIKARARSLTTPTSLHHLVIELVELFYADALNPNLYQSILEALPEELVNSILIKAPFPHEIISLPIPLPDYIIIPNMSVINQIKKNFKQIINQLGESIANTEGVEEFITTYVLSSHYADKFIEFWSNSPLDVSFRINAGMIDLFASPLLSQAAQQYFVLLEEYSENAREYCEDYPDSPECHLPPFSQTLFNVLMSQFKLPNFYSLVRAFLSDIKHMQYGGVADYILSQYLNSEIYSRILDALKGVYPDSNQTFYAGNYPYLLLALFTSPSFIETTAKSFREEHKLNIPRYLSTTNFYYALSDLKDTLVEDTKKKLSDIYQSDNSTDSLHFVQLYNLINNYTKKEPKEHPVDPDLRPVQASKINSIYHSKHTNGEEKVVISNIAFVNSVVMGQLQEEGIDIYVPTVYDDDGKKSEVTISVKDCYTSSSDHSFRTDSSTSNDGLKYSDDPVKDSDSGSADNTDSDKPDDPTPSDDNSHDNHNTHSESSSGDPWSSEVITAVVVSTVLSSVFFICVTVAVVIILSYVTRSLCFKNRKLNIPKEDEMYVYNVSSLKSEADIKMKDEVAYHSFDQDTVNYLPAHLS